MNLETIRKYLFPPSESAAESKMEEQSFNIDKLKSFIKEIFSRRVQNDRVTAQQQFAYKCADFLNNKIIQNGSDGLIRWDYSGKHVCVATVNEYSLKCKMSRTGEVKTKLTVTFVEQSSLAENGNEQRIALLLNNIGSEAPASDWTKLLQNWTKFTNSFRKQGFSNLKLIFCAQNGERVKIQCESVKNTIIVFLNTNQYEEILFRVDEINKRTLGRLIITLCGNEGVRQTTEQAGLRRLLQAFITKIEGEEMKQFNDVKLSLYGQDNLSFHIQAGKSLNPKQIVGYADSKGEFLINERESDYCIIS
ncbi:uncharacterized protein LOC117113139 [Anneissia japonica]|uniref:uncharacterized protein LOC117113139 n=1 Tax=Anneissia japonica TaxID=1529436 RepID=UPI0014258BE0|nr:uncharacterized protein LOC117113139 [Anneissia japonica]